MATILDTSVLSQFTPIFTWLFTIVILFAVLQTTKILGANKMLDVLVAFSLSVVVLVSPTFSSIIAFMAPWFIILGILFMFIMLITQFMNIKPDQFLTALGGNNAVWWIIIPGLIIMAFALSNVFGQTFLEERTGTQEIINDDGTVTVIEGEPSDFDQGVLLTLTNPNILGMLLLMIIATFTVVFIARG